MKLFVNGAQVIWEGLEGEVVTTFVSLDGILLAVIDFGDYMEIVRVEELKSVKKS